ncbi:hypothetical protein ACFFUB_14865 [Algimonas porphyrae]|uniref:C-type cytochrome biogenesis protein CcmI n=1 Tax=Algimonas porphyrae TaxID=1128113 RepID=A0ABQ5UZ40_9PROT|nr:hypothetical protein [Algimonas porphyrae]GLQ19709.1 hypothetical protein GCM10007854_06640 [Algimonas porphyrae]
MIWVILAILVLMTLLVLAPAFVSPVQQDSDELSDYFAQLDALSARTDLDADTQAAARLTLERQILKAERAQDSGGGRWLAAMVFGALLIGGATIYGQVGHPGPLEQPMSEQDSLLAQLEARLATDRADDPVGWTLYARALASLGRRGEAARAYDRALELNDDPALRAEAESAIRGPSQEDINAAMEMSEEDRRLMIRGMVDRLAERLYENPQDAPGWIRLIRARIVLGDPLDADIARMRAAYVERQDVADQILREAGYPPPESETP